ncbi:MAG: hypothetical protein SGI89_14275 [bacterium]|nr:hypothetical protein [bacterium]
MNNSTTPFPEEYYDKGKKLIERLDDDGFKYPIIFWINLPDKKEWSLLFGIPGLKLIGKNDILGNMKRIIREEEMEFDTEKISLIDSADPLCIALKTRFKMEENDKIIRVRMSPVNVGGFQLPETVIYRIL